MYVEENIAHINMEYTGVTTCTLLIAAMQKKKKYAQT